MLLICGSARNDGICPGEMSKTFRLLGIARETLEQADIQSDVLDLSLLISEYSRKIHPCKGCVSTAMPLCHWPCSCYPNHVLSQTNDWMGFIDAGSQAQLDRYIGYYKPYATSHEALDRDEAVREEARNVARAAKVIISLDDGMCCLYRPFYLCLKCSLPYGLCVISRLNNLTLGIHRVCLPDLLFHVRIQEEIAGFRFSSIIHPATGELQ